MISYIKGMVADIEDSAVTIECNGIGYHIHTTPRVTQEDLRIGEDVSIYTYLQVKEDDMQLYGFTNRDDLAIYKLLISVNGIGPKAGLGILSGLSADEIRFAVLSDDAATISKAPGVGKKTAQKLILELKDKFDLQDAFEQKLTNQSANANGATGEAQQEAIEALSALGYSGASALKAVKQVSIEGQEDVSKLLKEALKIIR